MPEYGGEREHLEALVPLRCCTQRGAGRLYAVVEVEARTLSQAACEEAGYRLGSAEAPRNPPSWAVSKKSVSCVRAQQLCGSWLSGSVALWLRKPK